MAELFANNFATQLTIGCAPADTVIHVALPAPAALQGGQFRVLIDAEYMLVTGGQSTTTWNVTRGAGTGESPVPIPGTHFAGVWVTHLWTAAGIAHLSNDLSGAVTSVAGKAGAVTLASTDLTDSTGLERKAAKDQASGYAGLDAGGLLNVGELPAAVARIAYASTSISYAVAATDRVVGVTDTSVSRTVTLAAASSLADGTIIAVKDQSGGAAANPIIVAAQGADTIDGAAAFQISSPYGSFLAYARAGGYSVIVGGAANVTPPPVPVTPPVIT